MTVTSGWDGKKQIKTAQAVETGLGIAPKTQALCVLTANKCLLPAPPLLCRLGKNRSVWRNLGPGKLQKT